MKKNKKENIRELKKIAKMTVALGTSISWIASQYYAFKVNFNPTLGGFKLGKEKIYFPFSYPVWAMKYKHVTPKAIAHVNKVTTALAIVGLVGIMMVIKNNQRYSIHGTAKWADKKEISDMNLNSPDGLVLGLNPYTGNILRDKSDRHVFFVAPTRMGKGINSVTPTALDCLYSMIINDIKGELWGLTSGYRKHVLGQKVFCFAPCDTDGISCQYNPLDFINIGTGTELEDVSLISQTAIDVDGKGESDHWITSAINLVNGVILHVKYSNPNASMTDVVNFLAPPNISLVDQIADILGVPRENETNEVNVALRAGDTKKDIIPAPNGEIQYPSKGYAAFDHLKNFKDKDLFKKIYKYNGTDKDLEARLHPLVAKEFMAFFKTPDKERGSILSTAQQKLKIFLDPVIAEHIKKSDFTFKELLEEKCTLYLVTPPKQIHRTKVLLRLIFTQAVFELTDRMSFKNKKPEKLNVFEKIGKSFSNLSKRISEYFYSDTKEKNKLLLMIDESTALGKLDIIEQSMAYVAGYGLKFFIIAQSINQFKKIYGENNYILDNCSIQIYLTPNDEKTPKMLSDLFDTYTEKIVTESKTGFWGKTTYNYSYVARKLMTPGEVRTLPYEEILLVIAGQNPIRGDKLFYYKDKRYIPKLEYGCLDKSDVNIELSKSQKEVYEKLNNMKSLTVIDKREEDFEKQLRIFNKAMEQATDEVFEEIARQRSNLIKKYFDEEKYITNERKNHIKELREWNQKIAKEIENEEDELYSWKEDDEAS